MDARPGTFTCSSCARQFARLEHLQRHARRHTKEKPYQCQCGKRFTRQDLLKRHTRLAHSNTTVSTSSIPSSSLYIASSANPGVASESSPDSLTCSVGQSRHDARTVLTCANDEAYQGTDCFADLPVFSDFGLFADTMGFMGVDLVDPIDRGSFLHYGVNTSFADARATLHDNVTPSPHIEHDLSELKPLVCPWRVSGAARQHLIASLSLEDARGMPSCLSLNRYCTGFFSDFLNHLPIVHRGTFDTETTSSQSPGLLLAIAAVGATYRFRTADALYLFKSSLHVILKRMHIDEPSDHQKLSTLQSLVLLEYFTDFHDQTCLPDERASVHQELAKHMKYLEPWKLSTEASNWPKWAYRESVVRTYLATFCIINAHSLLHNSAPEVLSLTIRSALPSSTIVWDAPSAEHWAAVIPHEVIAPNFQQVLTQLVTGDEHMVILSPFGCLILLHGILQRTYHLRQLSFDGTVRLADLADMEETLARWKRCWKRAPESMMDPRSLDASISWQSISYLMMAYLQLSRQHSPSFYEIAAHIDSDGVFARLSMDTPNLCRSDWNYNALLHSAHSLMIIVRTGIEHHRRTVSYHWDPQHVLPWIEGAISLSQWLLTAAEFGATEALTEVELAIVSWVRHIMKEALPSLGAKDIENLSEVVNDFALHDRTSIRKLSYGVVVAWDCIISQSNNPWPIVGVVSKLLKLRKHQLRPRTT